MASTFQVGVELESVPRKRLKRGIKVSVHGFYRPIDGCSDNHDSCLLSDLGFPIFTIGADSNCSVRLNVSPNA